MKRITPKILVIFSIVLSLSILPMVSYGASGGNGAYRGHKNDDEQTTTSGGNSTYRANSSDTKQTTSTSSSNDTNSTNNTDAKQTTSTSGGEGAYRGHKNDNEQTTTSGGNGAYRDPDRREETYENYNEQYGNSSSNPAYTITPGTTDIYAGDKVYTTPNLPNANNFIAAGRTQNNNLDTARLVQIMDESVGTGLVSILALLYQIGIMIAVCVFAFMGVQFVISSPQQKAQLKASLFPYFVGLLLFVAGVPIATFIINIFLQLL